MTAQHQFECRQCGSEMDYAIGQHNLRCISCGAIEPIESEPFNVFHAHPYDAAVLQLVQPEPDATVHHVQCQNCGAGFELPEDVHADECPYCDSNVIIDVGVQRQLKPDAVVPFEIPVEQANDAFKKWLGSRWFAPNSLKRLALQDRPLAGTYMPHWSFDADTESDYRGMRGDNYYKTVTVPVRRNGRTSMERRQVVEIRWRPVSGHVSNRFRNVLVMASEKISVKLTNRMHRWDLARARQYNRNYLSGLRSELYQIGLPRGHRLGRHMMQVMIRASVRRDIGGDHQRIQSIHSEFNNVGYKLFLLPLWMSAFHYQGKLYQFMVNGQNGEVQGERPWSWIKIISAALLAALVAALGYQFTR